TDRRAVALGRGRTAGVGAVDRAVAVVVDAVAAEIRGALGRRADGHVRGERGEPRAAGSRRTAGASDLPVGPAIGVAAIDGRVEIVIRRIAAGKEGVVLDGRTRAA